MTSHDDDLNYLLLCIGFHDANYSGAIYNVSQMFGCEQCRFVLCQVPIRPYILLVGIGVPNEIPSQCILQLYFVLVTTLGLTNDLTASAVHNVMSQLR